MSQETDEKIKKERDRSSSNPYSPLGEAISNLKEIRDKLGKGPYSRESMAIAIGHQTLTGSSARKVAAIVQFGLLTRQGNTYSQSPLADRILLPISEDDKKEAIVQAVKTPKLYVALINKFSGQSLPTLLTNILARDFGISEKTTKEVADNFTESIEFAGIFKNGVILETPDFEENREESTTENAQPFNAPVQLQKPAINTTGTQPVTLPSGIVILFPSSMAFNVTLGEFAEPIKKLDEIGKQITSANDSLEKPTD